MSLIDFILNLAGLLLWLNWLSLRFDPLAKTAPATLVGTLRRADPAGPKRWQLAAGLVAAAYRARVLLLADRPGVALDPSARLVRSSIFPSAAIILGRMLLFSFPQLCLSPWRFFISGCCCFRWSNPGVPDTDPLQKLVRVHFGWVESWPRAD